MSEVPTRDRIMAILSPPSQDVYLCVEDARWVKAEIERLQAEIERLQAEIKDTEDVAYGYQTDYYKARWRIAMLEKVVGFFACVIKSGEKWGAACDKALAELDGEA